MVEPLVVVLKEVNGKPTTLLRTKSGRLVATLHDEEYLKAFLTASHTAHFEQKWNKFVAEMTHANA